MIKEKVAILVDTLWQNLHWSHQRLEQSHRFVQAAERVVEGERARFYAGDSNLFRLNLREISAAKSRTQFIHAYAEYRRNHMQWKLLSHALGDCH